MNNLLFLSQAAFIVLLSFLLEALASEQLAESAKQLVEDETIVSAKILELQKWDGTSHVGYLATLLVAICLTPFLVFLHVLLALKKIRSVKRPERLTVGRLGVAIVGVLFFSVLLIVLFVNPIEIATHRRGIFHAWPFYPFWAAVLVTVFAWSVGTCLALLSRVITERDTRRSILNRLKAYFSLGSWDFMDGDKK